MRALFVNLLFMALSVPAKGGTLNLIAVGDTGSGSEEQWQTARGMERYCAKVACDGVLLLGDNIYPDGADHPDDPQFKTKFEDPYQNLTMPFYVILGNHDVHLGEKGRQAAIDYSKYSKKWQLPAAYYTKEFASVDIFALDTNTFRKDPTQQEWLKSKLAASKAPHKLIMGHHPIYSTGGHGNDDNIEGYPMKKLRDILEPLLCQYKAHYLSGHDHILQVNHLSCGVISVVSGAGGITRRVHQGAKEREKSTLIFAQGKTSGFAHLAISDEKIEFRIKGIDDNTLYKEFLKPTQTKQ